MGMSSNRRAQSRGISIFLVLFQGLFGTSKTRTFKWMFKSYYEVKYSDIQLNVPKPDTVSRPFGCPVKSLFGTQTRTCPIRLGHSNECTPYVRDKQPFNWQLNPIIIITVIIIVMWFWLLLIRIIQKTESQIFFQTKGNTGQLKSWTWDGNLWVLVVKY